MLGVLLVAVATIVLPAQGNAAPGDAGAGQVVNVQPLQKAAIPTVVDLPGSANATWFAYRSSGVGGVSAMSTGAVYFPQGMPPKGGWPVMAYAHSTVGIADQCAFTTSGVAAKIPTVGYLAAWLKRGYAVVATDYVGFGTGTKHPYLNGIVEAHNVVDSVRAATRQFPQLSKRWVVVGHSQGGQAAIMTARYATQFGPDLDYLGAVATGVPGHLEDVFDLLGPGVPPIALLPNMTYYVLYVLSGLRTTFPNMNIDSYLTPAGRFWVDRAEQLCATDIAAEVNDSAVVLGDLFAKPLSTLPNARAFLASYLGIPESGYDRPFYIAQGLRDYDIVLPATLQTIAGMQANHQPLTFHAYPTDHAATLGASLPESLAFADNLFAHH